MTKKKEYDVKEGQNKDEQKQYIPNLQEKTPEEIQKELEAKIPPEVKEKLDKIKAKLEKFKDQII